MVNKVRRPQRAEQGQARRQPQPQPQRMEMQAEIDRILDRLDAEIPEAHKRMDELLARLRRAA